MKTRKWKKTLLTFVLIGALLGVQVMEMVAFAAETGTDALEPSVVCSNYSQLYSAIIQAQDGDVIGINDTIIVGGNVNNVLGDTDKHVTIVRMNQLAVLYLSHSGTFTIQNITFDGNGIDSGNNMILVNNSCIMNDVTVQNCSMSLYYGAAVQVLGGTTTMNRCTFKNNIANEGGHIAVMNDSVLNMTECTMTEGKASQNGGAIYYNSSAAQYGEISSSVIHANSAGSSGGGIYVASGNLIVNPTSKLYGNTAPTGEDMTALVTGQGSYTDNLETLNALFAEDNIRVIGLDWTQDPDTATKYYKLYYEEIVQEDPSDTEDTGDDTTEPGTDEPSTDTEDTGTDEEPSTPTEPSVPDDGDDGDQEEPTAPSQPGDSDQDSTKDPDAGDSEQDSTDNGGNTDNSSNNGNTTNTTENSGNTTNTDNSSNDNTTVDNSSNDVVTDNSDHSSIDNSQTDNSQTTTDNSDHSTTTNTSDNSSHDTNTTTTNNSSDNSSKTTTTDNSQRSEDNSSVVTTYNYYQNPENQSQVQQGQQMQPIVVNNYIQQPSQEGQQVEEADDPSNNIKIDAEGVDVVFEMVDGVYSISIKAVNEPQAVQTVQDAVVPASNQAAEPAFNVNWYEIIKIGLLVAILVNVMWKPRQNSPA